MVVAVSEAGLGFSFRHCARKRLVCRSARPSLGQPGLSQAIRQPGEILGAAKRHLLPEIGKTEHRIELTQAG